MTEEKFSRCISEILGGDMNGLKEIYIEYGKMIYSAALQICRSPQTAEDVTSEFFLKLKKAASVYREGIGHKKWLAASARNLAIDHLRRQKHEILMSVQAGDDESHPLSEVPDSTDIEGSVTSDMNAVRLLMTLGENEREVVNLKVYCGFTFSEIADLLKIPIGTAAWRYQSAIKKLRKLYGEVQI